MNRLPESTINLISSTQVISSVSAAVKELIENALDANATFIQVRLENFGLLKIEVEDDGQGISKEQAEVMAKRHYTSKITCHDDLMYLETYGFRGEALYSLCAISELSVLSRVKLQEFGSLYKFDHRGDITAITITPREVGTTVIVKNIFKNLPVRRQFYQNRRKCKEELSKIENLLIEYAIIYPSLRIILKHDKRVIWQKAVSSHLRESLIALFGSEITKDIYGINVAPIDLDTSSSLDVSGFIRLQQHTTQSSSQDIKMYTSVNKRPVSLKQLNKKIKSYLKNINNWKIDLLVLQISVPPHAVDVNIEPNKTTVMLENMEHITSLIINAVDEVLQNIEHSTGKEKEEVNLLISSTGASVAHENGSSQNDTSVMRPSKFLTPEKESNSFDVSMSTVKDSVHSPINSSITTYVDDNTKGDTPDVQINEWAYNCSHMEASKSSVKALNSQISDVISIDTTNVNLSTSEKEFNSQKNNNVDVITLVESKTNHLPTISNKTDSHGEAPCNDKVPIQNISTDIKDNEIMHDKTKSDMPELMGKDSWSDEDIDNLLTNGVIEDCTIKKSDEKSAMDVSCLSQMSLDGWSRGTALRPLSEKAVEPSHLLAPIRSERQSLPKTYRNAKENRKVSESGIQNKESENKDSMTRHKSPPKKKSAKVPSRTIKLSMEHLQNHINTSQSSQISQPLPTLCTVIGNLADCNVWVVKKKDIFWLFSPYRAQEMLVYHSLLDNHSLPMSKLAKPMSLSDALIGNEEYKLLQDLSTEYRASDLGRFVSDKRITENGFDVRVKVDPDNSTLMYDLFRMNQSIPFYGVKDFSELLQVILNDQDSTMVKCCRPFKVLNYLKSEATRIARSSATLTSTEQVQEILNQVLDHIGHEMESKCFHGKSIFYRLNVDDSLSTLV